MRIAILERFASPSRRCDPDLISGPDDETVVWDLHLPTYGGLDEQPLGVDRIPSLVDLVRAVPAWAFLHVSPRRWWRLLCACRRLRGGRRTALVRTPGWVRQLRAHEVDEVACFSTYEFPLAELLAEETGAPCRELLAQGTQYFGEFAFELLAVVPYAYWLHERGLLRYTVSSPDTRCLYYFSPEHIERPVKRRYVPITEYPVGEHGDTEFDLLGFPTVLDTTKWTPPPYRRVYTDDRFRWSRPPVIVCNKASAERRFGRGFAVNYLDVDLLLDLVGQLRTRYTVIYDRPRGSDIVEDGSEIREFGDIDVVRQTFPEVITIQDLHEEHPELTFNELQLRLFATCERFVSVVGGSSYLASYFGGTNIVYAQQGWEVDCGAFSSWFDEFSGARVIAAATPAELIRAAQSEFLGGVSGTGS